MHRRAQTAGAGASGGGGGGDGAPAAVAALATALVGDHIADDFEEVTILWTDMKGFTTFCARQTPMEVVVFLNAMFSTFDRVLEKYGVRKIEVVGDALFCCAGVPAATPDHAERCVNAALEMLLFLPALCTYAGGAPISMRVGVHTGPVTAGVVGSTDPRYHLFGDSVTMANAMESTGVAGAVQISEATYRRLAARQVERAQRLDAWLALAKSGSAGVGPAAATPASAPAPRALADAASVGRYPVVDMAELDLYLDEQAAAADVTLHSADSLDKLDMAAASRRRANRRSAAGGKAPAKR
jgi:class 3 adenylate cyclase